MQELVRMWRNTRMVVITALTASVYAAILIPFKGIQIIPGFTEIRPAAVVPVVFGILFGPAGAWGSAIGNLIGDFFGTLGIGSFFGFWGNFFYALTAYKLWGALRKEPDIRGGKDLVLFLAIVIISSIACGFFIAWGLETVKLLYFAALGSIIPLNNSIVGIILGPPIFKILAGRVKKWGIYWRDILPQSPSPPFPLLGVILIIFSVIGGWITGLLISTGKYDASLFTFGKGSPGESVVFCLIPFILIYLVGIFLA